MSYNVITGSSHGSEAPLMPPSKSLLLVPWVSLFGNVLPEPTNLKQESLPSSNGSLGQNDGRLRSTHVP